MNHGIADRIVAFLAAGLVVLGTTSGCGDSATEPPSSTPNPPRPTTVMVNPATAELAALGATVQLTAEVRDQNNRVMAGATVTWSSGDASVATVGAAGLVTAVANGTATITAASGGISGTASVTVAQALDSVTVSPTEATIAALGDTVRLAAQVFDANGHAVAGAEFSWEASDVSVATVSASGLVTAAGNGTATITATAGSASGSAAVAVAQEVSAVAVTPAADTVVAGGTRRLAAEAADANGHPVAGSGYRWASSDTLVAVVDDAGLVTGVGAGEAEVTATAAGVTGRAAVTVVAPAPTVVVVAPDTLALPALGQTAQLDAEVHDQIGRVMEGIRVSWSSADPTVAAVDSAGLVTAVGSGATTITATAGEAAGYALVRVMQSAGSVVVSPPAGTVALGDTLRLAAEAFDANGHLIEGVVFAWSSSDGSVAMVDATGLVRGVAEGAATITAISGSAAGSSEITVENPDRAVLVALYEATGGRSWTRRDNWLSDEPMGEWHGVGVDSLGRVTSLNLGWNGLTGPIPTELGGLANLRSLWLPNNELTGPIPPELGALTQLEELTLGGNELSGPIPTELGGLVQLESLNLGWNELSGPIPTELGGLANLRSLWLPNNELTGPIPPELGALTQLEELTLGGNELSGPIPTELGGFTRLESLNLGWNGLTGPIPTELGGLANLRSLWLPNNELTGPIPPELGALTQLEELILWGNGLTGPVPTELGGLTQLESLDLRLNELSGLIPRSLLDLAKLTRFHFSSWREEPLCAPGITEFANWLEAMEESEGPYCNERDTGVLESLFESAGGSGWTNARGWLDGPVLADWHGISADSLGRVTALDLSGNGLAGQLTALLGDLTHLTELRISENADLSGRLPLSLARLSLQTLHYSGTGLCAPVETPFRDWLSMIPSHERTDAGCAQHYPINVTWHWCDWTPEGCRTLQEIDPDTVAILPVDMTAGMRAGIAEWAQILAPTPAPAPYVIPPGGTPRRWDWWCKPRRLDWMPGDTIQAGLELHVVIEVDADPGDDRAPGAGGPPCFYDTWQHGGLLVPVLTGVIHVSPAWFHRDPRARSYVGWRWFAMHELGHVLGVGTWDESLEATPDGSGEVVTREAIVAAFDRLGGAQYPGKKVPVLGPHWHACVARNDVMGDGGFRTDVITDLSLSALRPGFKAEPQGHALPTDAWHTCPELK